MTARELIVKKIALAAAQIAVLEELLTDLDGEQPNAEASAGDPPTPKKKPGKKPKSLPEPSANGHAGGNAGKGRDNLVKIAKALAGGPRTQPDIITASNIPKGSISQAMHRGAEAGYWEKGADKRDPYRLTEKGREDLLGN